MQLSSRPDDCWSSHIVSAMTVLIQECMFEETLRNCEPIDLSRFVVDFRERHFEFWTPYSDGCPREHSSKILTYNRWCILSPKKPLTTRFPKYIFLDLISVSGGALACLRLVLQSLRDLFPPSGTLLNLSDWAFCVCR
jgi:hypothetical protein